MQQSPAGPGSVAAEPAASAANPAPDVGKASPDELERSLLDSELENVSVHPGSGIAIAYENRRYRRSVEALGRVSGVTGGSLWVGERRLGLLAAAIRLPDAGGSQSFRVLYPSDPDFPDIPGTRPRSVTFTRADLDVGALVDYRLGNIYNPFQSRTQLELRLLLNPWPGAQPRLSVAFPLQSDLPSYDEIQDVDQVRVSHASLDQFGWVRGLALVSASAGYFGDNRWGLSIGAARPIRGGEWLVDLQVDRTGFLALAGEGTYYSSLERTSGFAGVTYRPPVSDIALKARAAQFLHGDRGVEFEARRTFDDLDVAYFVQRTDGLNVFGVRLQVPIPPMTRAAPAALRVQPTARFALDFRDQELTYGTDVTGVASREDHLRQLSEPSLAAGRSRYESAVARTAAARRTGHTEWVSLNGMSGFVQTPWAGVLSEGDFEVGYDLIPKEVAFDHRDRNDNEIYYATLGFLPRVETAMRWTRIPGHHSFEELAPDSRYVDMDRMASARLSLLEPRTGRPGLALGVEDVQGTRRFHSSYAVAGMPFHVSEWTGRVTAGYGFRLFDADRYVLDGAFGAAEMSPWPWLLAQLEYDTEKWNAGVGLRPIAGLQIRAALLNMESASVGAGWSHKL